MGLLISGGTGTGGHLFILIIGLSWLCLSTNVEGLKCFYCNGFEHCRNGTGVTTTTPAPKGEEEEAKVTKVKYVTEKECVDDESMCIMIAKQDVKTREVKFRGCATEEDTPDVEDAVDFKEGCQNVEREDTTDDGKVCFCKKDLCNTSAKKYPPSLMILLATSTLIVSVTASACSFVTVTNFGVRHGRI